MFLVVLLLLLLFYTVRHALGNIARNIFPYIDVETKNWRKLSGKDKLTSAFTQFLILNHNILMGCFIGE